jgi:hypothetical protein
MICLIWLFNKWSDASLKRWGTAIDRGNPTVADKFMRPKRQSRMERTIDYVCNYEAFKNGDIDELKKIFWLGKQQLSDYQFAWNDKENLYN